MILASENPGVTFEFYSEVVKRLHQKKNKSKQNKLASLTKKVFESSLTIRQKKERERMNYQN